MDNQRMKVCYSNVELEEFKEVILEKLAKAKKELDFVMQALNKSKKDETIFNLKLYEDGAVLAEEDNLGKLATRQHKFIMHLESALERIKEGSYGICVSTGKLIDKNRLKLVPHTTHSVFAKQNIKATRSIDYEE
jgi:DnaK suppressor protein